MKSAEKKRNPEFVEALARGIAAIEAFDDVHSEMSLTEVARRTSTSPATARRSLRTLELLGYVRCVNKRYVLAPKILTLGSAFVRAARIDETVVPELRRIVEQFGDSSSMAVLDGDRTLYVAHFSIPRAARINAIPGGSYPAYATSTGRVLMAFLDPAALKPMLARLKPVKLTDRTETSIPKLRKILSSVRQHGYSVTVDQLDYGITALAVPIRDSRGEMIAALNSSGYTGRLTAEQIVEERLVELRISADRIANTLSRHPVLAHSLGLRRTPT